MTALPASLASWEPELRHFARDLAVMLGDLVPRIAGSLGAPRSASHAAHGEPEGYDGITNRGPLTRLLASEWLLAAEMPDEFVRRVSTREQSFLALARADARHERTVTALFDAGPSQIGAPRIAQLALLVVLAQRARAMRAAFHWGILQSDGELEIGLDRASIRALLGARTSREPTAEDLARWVSKTPPESAERWLCGGAALESLEASATRITLEDDFDPEASRVVMRRGARGKSDALALDLPPSRARVRLLRDPFTEPADTARGPDSFDGARIVFSSDGRRLLVRLKSGVLLAYPVPNSPRAPLARPARYTPPKGCWVVATDWRNGKWSVVMQAGSILRVVTLGKRGGSTSGPRSCFSSDTLFDTADESAPLARLVATDDGLTFLDHPCGPLEIVHTTFRRSRAISVARSGSAIVSLLATDTGERRLEVRDRTSSTVFQPVRGTGDGAIRGGFSSRDAHPAFGVLAVRTDPSQWTIFTKARSHDVPVSAGFRCIGVADGHSLYGFYDDRPGIFVTTKDSLARVCETPALLVDACISAPQSYVAYVTDDASIVITNILEDVTLLRLIGETP